MTIMSVPTFLLQSSTRRCLLRVLVLIVLCTLPGAIAIDSSTTKATLQPSSASSSSTSASASASASSTAAFVETHQQTSCPPAPCSSPQCRWQCVQRECPVRCGPVCTTPKCRMECPGSLTMSDEKSWTTDVVGAYDEDAWSGVTCHHHPITDVECHTECQPADCQVRCPITMCRTSDRCPKCKIMCRPAVCRRKCRVLQHHCRPVCMTHPKCHWQCLRPRSCALPKCALQCDQPTCRPGPRCSWLPIPPIAAPMGTGNQGNQGMVTHMTNPVATATAAAGNSTTTSSTSAATTTTVSHNANTAAASSIYVPQEVTAAPTTAVLLETTAAVVNAEHIPNCCQCDDSESLRLALAQANAHSSIESGGNNAIYPTFLELLNQMRMRRQEGIVAGTCCPCKTQPT